MPTTSRVPGKGSSGPARSHSLRARSTALLLGFALLPALLLTALLLDVYFEGARNRVQNSLGAVADALALAADSRVQSQLRAVELAAALPWPAFDTPTASARLRLLVQGQPSVQVALAADREGRVIALHREGADADALRSRIGASVADRDYFQQALRLRSPQVSDVFVGRGLWTEAVVALSAPVLDAGGDPLGVLQVSLDLRLLAEELGPRLDRGRLGLVLDAQGQVVFASAALGLRAGDPVRSTAFAGLGEALGASELVELTHEGRRYFVQGRRSRAGWLALALLPAETLGAAVPQALNVLAPVLLLSLAGAWWAARSGAAWLTGPVRALARRIAGLQPGAGGGAPAPLAERLPRELQPIAAEVEALAAREREAFSQLDFALREREHEIERRTAALRRAVAALRDESRTDSLTGVGNYRAYRQALEEAWQTIAGSDRQMAVLLVDIDHFKLYNDAYGHPAGDVCLRRVADALQHCAQTAGAQLARSGGEEFALVLAPALTEQASRLAERLVAAVAALQLTHGRSPFGQVTASVGLALAGWSSEGSPDDAVGAADQALYQAKHEGRNGWRAAARPMD